MAAALLCLGALLLLRPEPEPTVPAPPAAAPETPAPEPADLTLRFHFPEETRELRLAAGALLLPEEAPLEGYTFLFTPNPSLPGNILDLDGVEWY